MGHVLKLASPGEAAEVLEVVALGMGLSLSNQLKAQEIGRPRKPREAHKSGPIKVAISKMPHI